MIFWSVLFSFTSAKLYDNRETKREQKKWCDMVAHISQQKLDIRQMPRKMTVFLSAVPGDGIGSSRQYFKEYVKPILVAASMDYEVIEGRKEGDVRYGTAEQIRRLRRKKGEKGNSDTEPEMDVNLLSRLYYNSICTYAASANEQQAASLWSTGPPITNVVDVDMLLEAARHPVGMHVKWFSGISVAPQLIVGFCLNS